MKKTILFLLLSFFSLSSQAICYTVTNLQGGAVAKSNNFGFSNDRYSNTNFYIEDVDGKIWIDTDSLQQSYKDYRQYKLNSTMYEAFYSQGNGVTKFDFQIDAQTGKVIYTELKSGWGVIDGAKIMVGDLINTTEGSCPK